VSDEFEFGQQELHDPLDRTGLKNFTPVETKDTPREAVETKEPLSYKKDQTGRKKGLVSVIIGVGIAAGVAAFVVLSPNETTSEPLPAPEPTVETEVTPEPTPTPVEPTPVEPTPVEPEPEVVYTDVERVVGFTPFEASLSDAGKEKLDEVITRIPEGVSVDVFGYVSEYATCGGRECTRDDARALTVSQYLQDAGVSVNKIEGKDRGLVGVTVSWVVPSEG